MNVHVFTSRVLDVVPRSPAEFGGQVRHALQVLQEEPRMLWSCVLLVLAGLALALARGRGPSLAAALAVAVTGFVWLRVSQVREGTILVYLAPDHGLTTADLLFPLVGGLAGAIWLLRRVVRRPRRHRFRALLSNS